MDTSHYNNIDLLKIWKNIFCTFLEHCVGMTTSCDKRCEKPLRMKKTMKINKFIPMFYLVFGVFISVFTPTLAERIDKNGRIVVNMSPKAAEFFNGTVWTE